MSFSPSDRKDTSLYVGTWEKEKSRIMPGESPKEKVRGHYQFWRSGQADLIFSGGFDLLQARGHSIISARTFMGRSYHYQDDHLSSLSYFQGEVVMVALLCLIVYIKQDKPTTSSCKTINYFSLSHIHTQSAKLQSFSFCDSRLNWPNFVDNSKLKIKYSTMMFDILKTISQEMGVNKVYPKLISALGALLTYFGTSYCRKL